MAAVKAKFRTIQEEYFEPDDQYQEQSATSGGNGMFIAVVAAGVTAAVLLGTVLSLVS